MQRSNLPLSTTAALRTDPDNVIAGLRDFILRFAETLDLQFETVPYPLQSHEGIAYLLLVASVNQSAPAEHVRDFLAALHQLLGDDLLSFHDLPAKSYVGVLAQFALPSWKIHGELGPILRSASKFASEVKGYGGFVERATRFRSAMGIANRIATRVHYMGANPAGARKKVWMFMRWMVRPAPDIGVWSPPLEPAELRVPLDTNTGRAFTDILRQTSLGDRIRDENIIFGYDDRGAMASTASNVEAVTQVARWLFPDDPARVDYAFFCYGRRFATGDDAHRCWKIVGCADCPIREFIGCPGRS